MSSRELAQIALDYPGRIAVVEMHIRPDYPLYCEEADNRKNYYEPPYIYGWLYYDGDRHGMTNYTTWRDRLIARMAIPSPVTMTMWGDYTPLDGSGTVHVQFRNDSTDALTGRIMMVVTEDSLYYAGPNLDSIHNYVARDYLPDENGEIVTIAPNDSVTVTRTFTIDTSWVERACRIVAWIQNDSVYADSTREVWQGRMATLGDLIGVREYETMGPRGETVLPATLLAGPIDLPSDGSWSILNAAGRSVAIPDMRPGVYFVMIKGKVTQKVVKIR